MNRSSAVVTLYSRSILVPIMPTLVIPRQEILSASVGVRRISALTETIDGCSDGAKGIWNVL